VAFRPQQEAVGIAEDHDVARVLGDLAEHAAHQRQDAGQGVGLEPRGGLGLAEHAGRRAPGIHARLRAPAPGVRHELAQERRARVAVEDELVGPAQKTRPLERVGVYLRPEPGAGHDHLSR
jgi:hypothetical protein